MKLKKWRVLNGHAIVGSESRMRLTHG